MKQLNFRLAYFLLIISSIMISSCSKEKIQPRYTSLEGEWASSFEDMTVTFEIINKSGILYTANSIINWGNQPFKGIREKEIRLNTITNNKEIVLDGNDSSLEFGEVIPTSDYTQMKASIAVFDYIALHKYYTLPITINRVK